MQSVVLIQSLPGNVSPGRSFTSFAFPFVYVRNVAQCSRELVHHESWSMLYMPSCSIPGKHVNCLEVKASAPAIKQCDQRLNASTDI